MNLSENDRRMLGQTIDEAEKKTKVQIVLATVKRSDNYAEIPWKAFALGSSLTGLMVFISGIIMPVWISNLSILFTVVAVLATGGFFALLTVLTAGFARLFLSRIRAETETRQYGESVFLNRELYSTTRRNGILLLVSLFERQVFILPDKGLADRLTKEAISDIILEMAEPLARKELKLAMETGLGKLVEAIKPLANDSRAQNELSNSIIEEKGI